MDYFPLIMFSIVCNTSVALSLTYMRSSSMKLLLHHQISASFAQTNAILLSAPVSQSSKTNWLIIFYETAISIYYSGHMFDQNEHVNNCSKIQLQEQTVSKALKSALNTSSLCVTLSFRSFLEMLSRLKHTSVRVV